MPIVCAMFKLGVPRPLCIGITLVAVKPNISTTCTSV
jgi:hypothetical protein